MYREMSMWWNSSCSEYPAIVCHAQSRGDDCDGGCKLLRREDPEPQEDEQVSRCFPRKLVVLVIVLILLILAVAAGIIPL